MASCTTKEWVSYSPNAKLTVTQSSSTDTTVTLAWTLQYITDTADPAYTNGIGRAWSVTIDGAKVKSGTYNINLVHGTKDVASGTTTVDKTKSTRNVSFSLSFEFNITWNNVYCDTLTASSSISIAAKTSYTVSYNANGGSGAPSNQTKWHGESLTLSSTKPTRTGYTFAGWGSSADDTTPINQPGGTYTGNAKYTYYAIWSENALTVKYYSNYADYCTYKGEVLDVSANSNVLVDTQKYLYDNSYSSGLSNIQNSNHLYLSRTGYTPTGYWGTSTSGGTLIDQSTSYSTGQDLAKAFGKDISNGDATATVYAQWQKNTYKIEYYANGGYGSMNSQTVEWQETFSLLANTFKREGYKFAGWNLYRNADNKWYVSKHGWLTEDEIITNGYSKQLYLDERTLTFEKSWIEENEDARLFTLYATWEISGVVYIDNGMTFEPYLVYIDNGSGWDLYLAYIDNGTEWKIIS